MTTTTRDIPYGADERQRYDVYTPDQPAGSAVLLIHGGGWWQGDKAKEAVVATRLAQAGHLVIAPNYRLADGDRGVNLYPTQAEDVSAALATVDASALAFDRSRLAVMGGSSGGNLAVETGVRHGLPVVSWSGLIVLDDFMQRHQSVSPRKLKIDPMATSAMVDQTGGNDPYYKWLVVNLIGSDDPAAIAAATATHRITARCRPMFLANSLDELVPAGEVFAVARALARSGVAAQTMLLPGSRHAEGYADDAFAATLAFLTSQIG